MNKTPVFLCYKSITITYIHHSWYIYGLNLQIYIVK